MSVSLETPAGMVLDYRVHLLEDAVEAVKAVAGEREARVLERGWQAKGRDHGAVPLHERQVEGAGAECALAVWLGEPWAPHINDFGKRGDAAGLEVRRIWQPRWRLAVYAADHLDRRFVLVYGFIPDYEVIGWLEGREAVARGERFESPRRWYVPQEHLRDPEELRRQDG